jgi:hypothetical protein
VVMYSILAKRGGVRRRRGKEEEGVSFGLD